MFRDLVSVRIVGKLLEQWDIHYEFIVRNVLKVPNCESQIDIVWCTKTCAKKDESHSSENKFITCPGRNKDWNAYILIF